MIVNNFFFCVRRSKEWHRIKIWIILITDILYSYSPLHIPVMPKTKVTNWLSSTDHQGFTLNFVVSFKVKT